MEQFQAEPMVNSDLPIVQKEEIISSGSPFIEANTISISLEEIRSSHIIPVFIKDNEPLISQVDFVESMNEMAEEVFLSETILRPSIRLSHPIKGRIPSAKNKPSFALLESEKTIYYERMAFVIEIPSIQDEIDGQMLSLMVGGVKSFNEDNLYNKKGADEHFKIFIGFKNTVCTNLCIWTDGFMGDLKVRNLGQLKASIFTLLNSYNANYHLFHLKQIASYSLTEQQFALLVGRSKMYGYLPTNQKKDIPPLFFGDAQLNAVTREFYRDTNFSRHEDGTINLWQIYNLFTGANKSSYIDSFLERSVNAFDFVEQIRFALEGKNTSWYLS